MTILALDPGSTCGWAVGWPGGLYPAYGTWDIRPRRGESVGMRYLHLRRHLEQVRAAYPDLSLVVYEQAHQRGGAATEYAVGCATETQSWCAEHGIEHAAVHSATLKKQATGDGRASKDDMRRQAAMMYPGRVESWRDLSSDEADAILLLNYARRELVPS